MRLFLFWGKQYEETFENPQVVIVVLGIQKMRLFLFWGKQFEDTFENAHWRIVKQVHPLWLATPSEKNRIKWELFPRGGGGGWGWGFHPIFFACQNLPKVLWALRDYCTTAVWHYGTTALRLYGTTRHYSIMALRHYGTTGSFRINVKSKMAFMGINFHKNWIFGVVLGCLHRDILILWCLSSVKWKNLAF